MCRAVMYNSEQSDRRKRETMEIEITMDGGFQFGLGAFETIAVENGRSVFLQRHLNRLERTASFLGLGSLQERGITEKSVQDYLQEKSVQADPEGSLQTQLRHGALKIMLSEKNVVFQMRENHYTEEMYEHGFRMDFSKVKRNETSPLVYHKTMNYGDCILEKRVASARGMQECIFLNTRGEIAEGAVSNIFFVKQGHLFTPKVSCGLLPGIIREYLLDTEEVAEAVIRPEKLEEFEECFVTNSLMGIMPVKSLGMVSFCDNGTAKRLREKIEVNVNTENIHP